MIKKIKNIRPGEAGQGTAWHGKARQTLNFKKNEYKRTNNFGPSIKNKAGII